MNKRLFWYSVKRILEGVNGMNDVLISQEFRDLGDVLVYFDPKTLSTIGVDGTWKYQEAMGVWTVKVGKLNVEFPTMDWCDKVFVFLSVTEQVTSAMDSDDESDDEGVEI